MILNSLLKHIGKLIIASACSALMFTSFAYAQTTSNGDTSVTSNTTAGITFPIAELGNCNNKDECRAYCDEGTHMDACISFAKAHGLMSKEEATNSEKFSTTIKQGQGPGKCDSPASCTAYCEQIANTSECLQFAEQHNFKGKEYNNVKKLTTFLKNGGTMPGGCTSRGTCEAYCSDFSHAEECSSFAQKVGISDNQTSSTTPNKAQTNEQFKKLAELVKSGQTPGGCTSKDTCEAYCRIDGHLEECLAFGERAGFISHDVASSTQRLQGKGPGGCDGEDACRAFCNVDANRDVCFKFAEDNHLISKEDIKQSKDGLVRIRQGIENASPSVKDCLSSTIGSSVIEDIQSGKLTPGTDITSQMKSCFDKFGEHKDPKKVVTDAPDAVRACLKDKLGTTYDGIISGKTEPTPEMADAFRLCYQKIQIERGDFNNNQTEGSSTDTTVRNGTREQSGQQNVTNKIQSFLRSAPPEVSSCVKEKLGDDLDKIISGEITPPSDFTAKIGTCFQQFRPKDNSGTSTEMNNGQDGERNTIRPHTNTSKVSPVTGMTGGDWFSHLPENVKSCLASKIGTDKIASLVTQGPNVEIEQLVRTCFNGNDPNNPNQRDQGGTSTRDFNAYPKFINERPDSIKSQDGFTPPKEMERPAPQESQ